MDACPVCGVPGKSAGTCRNCGTDLMLLHSTSMMAASMERIAVTRLAAGDARGAFDASRRAVFLRRTPLSDAIHGFLRLEAKK
ncbi:MAG: hypothetical protein HZA20_01635 [Nitrospirae bacterium]|nr:hypothetical protein [Nitrospirota bacterium]